jgi:NADPH:quinone reductase-like Zn-dependent oxidoreductase
MYAVASRSKHAVLEEYGAFPIDYRTQDFMEVIRQAEPDGLDAVISGMTTMKDIRRGLAILRKGGKVVCFGEPDSRAELFQILGTLLTSNLSTHRKSISLYGTSTYFLGFRKPYEEDWAVLFRLLEEGKIKPILAKKYPILEAAQANAFLESGQVIGNVVLVTPELL